jgi:dinuclear metal center YbgI/SA1388 family protein
LPWTKEYRLKISQFQKQLEALVPPAIAWKGDNVGLLIGRPDRSISNALIALDLTSAVIDEAKRKKANLIITHHPLLFHPVRSLTPSTRAGKLSLSLSELKLNLYAAHTNLDSVQWGVSFTLAQQLGIQDVQILSPIKESLTKIAVFVPSDHVDTVAAAMHSAGAGTFSKYDTCSFRSEGTGTFRGMKNAKPFIGKAGTVEKVNEIKLEMLTEQWKLGRIVAAMLKAHPYEEAAYDLSPLLNGNTEYGLGAIGTLKRPMTQKAFLSMIKKNLGIGALRYSGTATTIRRVAVCGGSGADYIHDAIAQGADAMVTADLKYHTFQDFEEKILLIDAGHYETESGVLKGLAAAVARVFKMQHHSGKVYITQYSTNPVHIF